MTFCLGIKVDSGLVGIADTLVTAGSECTKAAKLFTYQNERQCLFIMTSGLRSVRDKALTYFEEVLDENGASFDRVFKALNAFAAQVRRVAEEDKAALADGGLDFNMHALVGGQFDRDREHKLYMLYPQANWVEVGQGTPSQIIGASGYGKPVLDRTLQSSDPMSYALKVGCLAFDSTRISAADVDFPIDVVLLFNDGRLVQRRFEEQELSEISDGWQERLRNSVTNLPSKWLEAFFESIDARPEIPSVYADTPT